MKTIITSTPTVEPVSLSEAKAQLRIEDSFTLDDEYIASLISAARGRCESYCNQFFTEQGIKLAETGNFPSVLFLPYPDLTVTSIEYTLEDNTTGTLSPTEYVVDSLNQTIVFDPSVSPINFQVIATTAAPVDIAGVKHAIKIIVTDLYELRTETAVGVSLAENPALNALLYPYRLSLGI